MSYAQFKLNYHFFKSDLHKVKLNFQSSYFHRVSAKFPTIKDSSSSKGKGTLSVSHQLMIDNGIISSQHLGLFTLLPFGVRAVEKLIKLLDLQMKKVNGQKLSLPFLTSASLWKKSGRLETCGAEVMSLKDRHNHHLILSPTHEEAITDLVSSVNLVQSNLPVRLYQIASKFRDEMRLKHGLMRGREFIMKDLYTFDENLERAQYTYEEICKTYMNIFNILDLPIKKVKAPVGSIGGVKSHEFHLETAIGEDTLLSCKECKYIANCEFQSDQDSSICPNCKGNLTSIKGIEVGHSFLLGTKYSSPLASNYRDSSGKLHSLEMGCYGIGVTRLVSAGIESLSTADQLVWPRTLCPYKVCLIPPKKGSKQVQNSHWCDHLEKVITKISGYEDEVIVDDRTKLSIGQRLNQAKKFGYPIIIVIGKSSLADIPLFELHVSNIHNKFELPQTDILDYLKTMEHESRLNDAKIN